MSDSELDASELKARTERLRLQWAGDDATQTAFDRKQLRKRAREWSELAIATLVDTMLTGDSSSARIAAAKEILDRGFGRASGETGGGPSVAVQVGFTIDGVREQAQQLLRDPAVRMALRASLRELPAAKIEPEAE